MSQSSKIFIAREIMHKSRQYQISRYQIINNFKFLKSDTPFCFAYISAPLYRTEKFLYSRQSYGSHLSNELCPSLLAYLQLEKFSKKCGAFFSGHPVYVQHISGKFHIQGDYYCMSQKCWLITFILTKNWLFSPTSPLLYT